MYVGLRLISRSDEDVGGPNCDVFVAFCFFLICPDALCDLFPRICRTVNLFL